MISQLRLRPEEIETIHVTEYDTHKYNGDDTKTFYNGWSPRGLHDETTDRAEWSIGKTTVQQDELAVDRIGHSAVAIDHEGRQLLLTSLTPICQPDGSLRMCPYTGFVVSHGETESIGHHLGGHPFVSFVYRIAPCVCQRLLQLPKEVDATIPYKTLHGHLSDGGGDTIGILLVSRSRQQAWWAGSICSNQCAMQTVSPLQNGCTITTAAGILAGMQYALQHPCLGHVSPEEIDSEFVLKQCLPFLGFFTMLEVPWDLVQTHLTNQIQILGDSVLPANY